MNNVLNLGQIEKPLLIFGGCYSNLKATQTLKVWAEDNHFSPEQCICTGDIVAYCGNPIETVDLIRNWGAHCIQGNVEQSLSTKADDCGCGFEENTVCDILSRGWYPFADGNMPQHHRDWFKTLPDQLRLTIANQTVQVVHGAVSDVSRFMFLSQAESDFIDEFTLLNKTHNDETDVIIAGHSGLPFTKKIASEATALAKQKIWHNSGALGMPANDGTSNVWFSVINIANEKLTFTHQHLSYDVDATVKQMESNHLTQGYHLSLKTGLWPSMDVLPETEKQQQGQALKI